MSSVEVGVGIWSMQSTKAGPRHFSYLYKELMEDATFCDELQTIKTIWQTEHHFWYDGYCPSLLTVAGGIAAATKHIQIGQSTLLFSEHEALRVAHQAATVDQLSGGRLQLGLGLGYRDNEFDGFNVTAARVLTRGSKYCGAHGLKVLLTSPARNLTSQMLR